MPTYYRAQAAAELSTDAGNTATNTWHFADLADAIDPADAVTEIVARIDAFYTAFVGILPAWYGNPLVKVYAMADAPPRVPIATVATSIAPSAGQTLPAEVAVVLSFRGEYVSGVNKARLRGRSYVGPLKTSASDGGALSYARVASTTFGAIATAAANALFDPISEALTWVVRSEAGDMYTAVEYFAMNNEFDTMRSRQPTLGDLLNWQPLT